MAQKPGNINEKTAFAQNEKQEEEVAFRMAVGVILPFGGSKAPPGWLLCDGSEFSTKDFPELHEVIGTNYGSSGAGLFKVPDMQDRLPAGISTAPGAMANTLGATSGSSTFTLATSNLPSHNHTGPNHRHIGGSHSHGLGSHKHGVGAVNHDADYLGYPGDKSLKVDIGSTHGVIKVADSKHKNDTDAAVGNTSSGGSVYSGYGGTGNTGSTGSGVAKTHTPKVCGVNYIIRAR